MENFNEKEVRKKEYLRSLGRLIKEDEIVIEDIPEEDLIKSMLKLQENEYKSEYLKAKGQESGHVHVKDIKGLPGDLNKEQLNQYKKLFIKKYVPEELWEKVDFQLCGVHRIAEENKPHYKYGTIKKLINVVGEDNTNKIDKDLYKQAKEFSYGSAGGEVEDFEEIITKVIPHWVEGKRQELAMSLAGWLRKSKRLGASSVRDIIAEICKRAKDKDVAERIAAVVETFKKDEPKVKGISGLKDIGLEEDEFKEEDKLEIRLPKSGKLISKFCVEAGDILKNKKIIFFRQESRDLVEVGSFQDEKGKEIYQSFIPLKSSRFITLLEKFIKPGYDLLIKDKENQEGKMIFKEKSMTNELAKTILDSPFFQNKMPNIKRIFPIPLPIMYEGKLTFPNKGFDIRFNSWLPLDSPEIEEPKMKLQEAKEVIHKIYGEFCFKENQDYANAIAALITPFCRGLFSNFNIRTPIIFYKGNRERVGKDCCAGVTGMVYEGNSLSEPPISSGDKGNANEELRKKLLSAMMAGRKRLHFANNKGKIDNSVFEAVTTETTWSDRVLGGNKLAEFSNEIDYSLSGNINVTATPDFINRCIFVNFFLAMENANERVFKNPDLHNWVSKNRGKILSALYALVRNWINKGSPKGSLPFASFHEWAEIVGGIIETAGYKNPCKMSEELQISNSDTETDDMKQLFEFLYEKYPDKWINKSILKDEIKDPDNKLEIFAYLDLEKKSDQIKLGILVKSFYGRILSDIQLSVKDINARPGRQEVKFKKIIQKNNLGIGGIDGIVSKRDLYENKLYKYTSIDSSGKYNTGGNTTNNTIYTKNLDKKSLNVCFRCGKGLLKEPLEFKGREYCKDCFEITTKNLEKNMEKNGKRCLKQKNLEKKMEKKQLKHTLHMEKLEI